MDDVAQNSLGDEPSTSPTPLSPPPAAPAAPQEGTLYVFLHEALQMPSKPTRVSYYASFKPSRSQSKASSRPCLLARNNNKHPVWDEHFELENVTLNETISLQVINAKAEQAVTRMVGFSSFGVEPGR